LVIVGTVMSQRVAGPTYGSTHLYAVGISGSSSGKQQLLDCVKEALREIGAVDRIGPDDFRSSVGLINFLRRQSAFCSVMDEYGQVLQRIGNKRAGGFEQDLISIWQQLWGLNWTYYHSPAAAREKSKRIFSPAFSIFGVSVPEQFYGAVTLKQIAGGLLNRHLIIRGDDRPPLQDRAEGSWKLPAKLKEELKGLYRPRPRPSILDQTLDQIDEIEDLDDEAFEPEIRMPWGVGAKQIWTTLIAKLREEPDELRRNLFARVPEMTIRIATEIAFGRYSPTVDQTDMEWARAWCLESAEGLHRDVLKYGVEPLDFPALCQKILKLAAAEGGRITKRDLSRRCLNSLVKAKDLQDAIDYLIKAELLRADNRPAGPKGGRPSDGYALCE
jgi:hypothetical protein